MLCAAYNVWSKRETTVKSTPQISSTLIITINAAMRLGSISFVDLLNV